MGVYAFWNRIKKRKVYRLVLTYVVAAWGLIQVTSTLSTPLDLPVWSLKLIIFLVVLGFPVFLFLSWSSQQADEADDKEVTAEKVADKRVTIHEKSIAVLPFLNMNNDTSHEYFADGITENILTQLASIENLKVISRTSIMRYKNTLKSIPEIAQELGVKYILEGSAQMQGAKVRINAQLIEAIDDRHLWAKAFDEDIQDIFSIQNLVAGEVVKRLKATIQPGERTHLDAVPTQNMEAYDLYLKGIHAMSVYTYIPGGWKQAESFFIRAIEKDPNFKQAYSYLARVYGYSISWLGDLSPSEGYAQAQKSLNASMKLGIDAQDYTTMSQLEIFVNKNFEKGIELAKQALELNANDPEALYLYSYWLSTSGKSEEGLKMVERAAKVDPVSISSFNYRGIALYLMERYHEAIAVFKQSIELHPLSLRQYDHLAKIYLTVKKYQAAEEILNSGFAHSSHRPPSMVAYLAIAYHYLGDPRKAEKLMNELTQRIEAGEKGIAVFIAQFYAETNDMPQALDWLEKSAELNDVELFWIKIEPLFQSIRQNDRFQEIQKRVIQD